MGKEPAGPDFFISYASENRVWAEWIAVQLEQAGFSTIYQAADFRAGRDFLREMHEAVISARRTIAVLSPAYLVSDFGAVEWRAVFAKDPTGELGLLIPVRVQPCEPPGLLTTRVFADLVDLDESGARAKLLAAVDGDRSRPTTAAFPGKGSPAAGMRFPGTGPEVTNLPARQAVFTGRDEVIRAVYDGLRSDGPVAAVVSGAVHGLGGVGKTAVAVEYAYRFGSDYDLVWWIAAEQPATVAAQLAELGREMGLESASDERDAVRALFAHLRGRDRWLLIYDNAERPESLAELRPSGGGGQVLVTSRWPDWRGHARTVSLSVWSRAESVAFLRARTRHTDERVLGELAELVGDLPLAVEEAAAYLEQTGEGLTAYVELVRARARELFAVPAEEQQADQRRVATVWTLSLEQVHARLPVAEQLLTLLAFLAPDVPRNLPGARPDSLPAELGAAVSDRLAYNRLLEAVGRYALVTLDPDGIGMHRLVQAVVQERLDRDQERLWVTVAVGLLRAEFPNESWEPASWPSCQTLLPHLLAVTDHAVRLQICGDQAGWLLSRASTYLRQQGQYRQAEPLARRAVTATAAALGPEHTETAWRHDELGNALFALGRLDDAHTELEQALAISLATLGPNHLAISTLRNDLGVALHALGRLDDARTELEQALAISLATFGPDHPSIGIRRNNLGSVLRALGRPDDARTEFEQALAIGLATHGPDHPTIGIRRNNLGGMLRALGRPDDARTEFEQALAISLATYGPDHPTVGIIRGNLGSVLRALGRLDDARTELEQALAIGLAALGPGHKQTRAARGHLGSLAKLRARAETDPTSDPLGRPPPAS